MMKKIILLFLLVFGLSFVVACNDQSTNDNNDNNNNNDDNNVTETLEITETDLTLNVGEKYTFNVNVEVIISSSDQAVVSVNNKTITALEGGNAIVTIKLKSNEEVKKDVNVTVNKPVGTVEDVEEWLKNNFLTEGTEKISFPKTHPDLGGTISWTCDSELVNMSNGNVEIGDYDEVITLNYQIELGEKTVKGSINYTIIGFYMQDARDAFINQIKSFKISGDVTLKTTFSDCGGTTVTWSSSNEEIFSNTGKFTKPYDDSEVVITYTVVTTEPATSHTYSKTFLVDGLSIGEKAEPVKKWIDSNVGENGYLNEFSELPLYVDDYNATLNWTNSEGDKLVIADYVKNPILSGAVYVTITITIGGKSIEYDKVYKVENSNITDIWDKVELFVNQISSNSYNSALKVNSPHYFNGYIPFYTQGRIEVVQDIMAIDNYNRPGTIKSSTQYIVVHDTANTNSGAGARSQVNYLKNGAGGRNVSWHYTVDQDQCIQTIPDNEVAWHAGDGGRAWGSTYFNESYQAWSITGGSVNGIGIESCVNIDGNYALTERNLAKLVAGLLIDFNLGFDRVKQHNDFSGKNCPALIRGFGLWPRFIYLVQLEYYGLTELKDVTFTWESVSSNIDEKGLITKGTNTGTVEYKVTATYKGVSKTYDKSVTF